MKKTTPTKLKCVDCGTVLMRIPWNEAVDLAYCDNTSCIRFHYGIPVKQSKDVIQTHFPEMFKGCGPVEQVL
jgi:hypothetical protein